MTIPGAKYGKFTVKDGGLYPGSQPTQLAIELQLEEVDDQRRTRCQRYDNCLTHAASQNWRTWVCTSCDVDDRMSAYDERRDLEGFAGLLRALNLRTETWH